MSGHSGSQRDATVGEDDNVVAFGQVGEARSASGRGAEIVVMDADGVIVAANQAWREAGPVRRLCKETACIGGSYFDLVREFAPELEEAEFRRALQALAAGTRREVRYPYAVETQRGPRWRQVQITPLGMDGVVRFVVIHEDLTELVHAQEALRRTSEQLLTAQEDERRRFAMELHDSTSQHLAALGLGLARLRRMVRGVESQEVLGEMAESLTEAVRETRVLSYLMKPTGLLQEGLVATARQFVLGFGRRTGVATSYVAEGEVDHAPAEVQHAAFRIVQEALANVYRHSGARSVDVLLTCAQGLLTVEVSDDGCGIGTSPPADAASEAVFGVGILGMRARVEQLAGRLEIEGDLSGTRVIARMPAG